MDEKKVKEELTTQSLVIKSIWNFADPKLASNWTSVLNCLPSNIYSFVNRYLSNSLVNGNNAIKWGLTKNCACRFCDKTQTRGHVMGRCINALEEKRYNWRHDSILKNISKLLNSFITCEIYCDIDNYTTPSVITGPEYRPGIVIKKGNLLIIIELTAGYETKHHKKL